MKPWGFLVGPPSHPLRGNRKAHLNGGNGLGGRRHVGRENETTFRDAEHAKGYQRQPENESHCFHVLPPFKKTWKSLGCRLPLLLPNQDMCQCPFYERNQSFQRLTSYSSLPSPCRKAGERGKSFPLLGRMGGKYFAPSRRMRKRREMKSTERMAFSFDSCQHPRGEGRGGRFLTRGW